MVDGMPKQLWAVCRLRRDQADPLRVGWIACQADGPRWAARWIASTGWAAGDLVAVVCLVAPHGAAAVAQLLMLSPDAELRLWPECQVDGPMCALVREAEALACAIYAAEPLHVWGIPILTNREERDHV